MQNMSDLNINEDAQSGTEAFGESQSSSSSSAKDDLKSGQSSQPTIESSAFPDEDEETITMLDVIEREDELEEEASAVLGNSDEKNCTYPKGYIARQALYSCATCSKKSGKEAAICLACSLECHDNHDVYELYTKRNYRCDCGNKRFDENFKCKLTDKQNKKAPLNESNTYNHNFHGRYCNCDRQYPPEEGDDSPESNDEMWQCVVCEDWYHTKHLNAKNLPSKFEELACSHCVDRLDFIHYYNLLDKIEPSLRQSAKSQKNDNSSEDQDASRTEIVGPFSLLHSKPSEDSNGVSQDSKEISESDTNDSQAENRKPKEEDEDSLQKSSKDECILNKLKELSKIHPVEKGSIFWQDCNWRDELCRCQDCMAMYDTLNCLYLIDQKDTVQYYEAQGKALAKNSQSPIERGMSALNRVGVNRVAMMEAINGYNELKADLSVYLRKFADNNKVVREQDIHEFFKQLTSKKKPRLE